MKGRVGEDVDWGHETEEEAVGSLVVWREVEKGYR